jgi:5'-nucleotidase
MSLQTLPKDHFSLSPEVDFSIAAYFTHFFAEKMLRKHLPFDVDVLKVDVPTGASPDTPWKVTRQSRERYYHPFPADRISLLDPGSMQYDARIDLDHPEEDSDLKAVLMQGIVSVTPLSFDLTSRVNLGELDKLLR